LRPTEIIAIGGSAGSIQPLRAIAGSLPSEFPASIFVVVHVSADSPTMLPAMLARCGPLPVSNPTDMEEIERGHIYISRPDHHLTIEDGRIRVLRGPRENRHRPAIDPLFRTAARAYGPAVIGVLLSGLLDDGSAGLYTIKQRGGVAIVQDPEDAVWKSMPEHAIEYANPQYVLPACDIARALIEFVAGGEAEKEQAVARKNSAPQKLSGKNTKHQKSTNADHEQLDNPQANEEVAYFDEGEGTPSVFACPECHGVLWELKDGKILRFRCRTGHSYGIESLAEELSSATEGALWAAVRALEEKAAMQRRIAEGMSVDRNMNLRMLDQSAADAENARLIRNMIFRHDSNLGREQLRSDDKSKSQAQKSKKSESVESMPAKSKSVSAKSRSVKKVA
jgi:two-component system, chemotaxis family, protein-glutamate methylesterase/glutaminase